MNNTWQGMGNNGGAALQDLGNGVFKRQDGRAFVVNVKSKQICSYFRLLEAYKQVAEHPTAENAILPPIYSEHTG
jgi:hypothetical protein